MDGHMMKVFAIRFLPREPKRFLSGGWDGLIFKWDAISGECLMLDCFEDFITSTVIFHQPWPVSPFLIGILLSIKSHTIILTSFFLKFIANGPIYG